MGRSGEEEYQRFLGFRASTLPLRAFRPSQVVTADDAGRPGGDEPTSGPADHPFLWLRWRRAVRRDGPHAPDFPEYGRLHLGVPPTDAGPGPTG